MNRFVTNRSVMYVLLCDPITLWTTNFFATAEPVFVDFMGIHKLDSLTMHLYVVLNWKYYDNYKFLEVGHLLLETHYLYQNKTVLKEIWQTKLYDMDFNKMKCKNATSS